MKSLLEYRYYQKPFDSPVWNTNFTFVEQMMLMDTLAYLPDDILVKVDRAAMSVGLETRVPFLESPTV